VRKLGVVIGLVALAAVATQSFADVQNIRLSGDVRVRGYYLQNVGFDADPAVNANRGTDASFIAQRTRITCEVDLEDHVLVVATLKAEGLWGDSNNTATDGIAGMNNSWDVGISEAYVQLNEVFYTPATLKLGRQYLHYGRGFILSSADQTYNFDAARLILDWYPLTVDVVGAKLVENSGFDASDYGSEAGGTDLLWINAKYEATDSAVKAIEAYFGWAAQEAGENLVSSMGATLGGASPLIVGLRTDLNLTEGMQNWVEVAYEMGADGMGSDEEISAVLLNVGGNYTIKNCTWAPVLNAQYTYASGGGKDGRDYFRPWFNSGDGANGYLFHPYLLNLHIFNVGTTVKPAENLSLSVQAYYYVKADRDGIAISNPNVDYGLTGAIANGDSREVGWEFDTILGYDYSKDVRCQLVYAAFIPDKAIRDDGSSSGFDATAHEIRGEINVKF
jgi:hypothetical protein